MRTDQFDKMAHEISKSAGTIRTAGKIEFIRDQGPLRRDIRADDFEWSPDALKNLAKILWAAQRAHSYSVSALRLFSKMPSSQFSPDGLLGGRGYIQSIKELRKSLSQASEVLSSFTDTLYDEVNASHWEDSETDDTKSLIEETEEVKENPEAFVEGEYRSEGESDFLDSDPSQMNPHPSDYGMPEDEDGESEQSEESFDSAGFAQQASQLDKFNDALSRVVESHHNRHAGNSSLPISTLPGPRVDRIGPGEAPLGFYNGPESLPSDDLALDGFITDKPIYEDWAADGVTGYDNPTDGDNTFLKNASSYSLLPGSENLRSVPIYDRGLTDEDVEWLVAHSKPTTSMNRSETEKKPNSSWIWKDV
jgi:hypothetical protein